METKIFGLGASLLLAPAPFNSAFRTAEWPVSDFEEGALRFGLSPGSGCASLTAVDLQELSGAEYGDASKCTELSEVPIPGDQDLGSGPKSAFEDTAVRFVVPDDVNQFLGLNELRELSNARNGLSGSRGRPSEL